jgi:antitoxin component YwqK of YwqJK toxin-antitoxin module
VKKIVLFSLALSLLPFGLHAQNLTKKEASQGNIKTVSEFTTNVADKKAKPMLESKCTYDKNGNLLEIIEYSNSGFVTLHESYEYNADGLKTVEIQYEPNGSVKKKHIYKYTGNLRTERLTYDKKGTLIGQKKYEYELHGK